MNSRCRRPAPFRPVRPALSVLLLLILLLPAAGQLPPAAGQSRLRAMTYNVENLFDTCHDAGRDDHEFLPAADRRWTGARYRTKLNRICRVIAAAGGEEPVELVALCEVENDSVVRDLCERTMLRRLGYRYFVTDCADVRGIDVALLYQPMRFSPVGHTVIRLPRASGERPGRDVLHVAGFLPTGDTLDVLVCHMPSRRGGTYAAEVRRRNDARALRRVADSLCAVRRTPRLLLMGDFNDSYCSPSLSEELRATPQPPSGVPDPSALYVLSAGLKSRDGISGTYKYRGLWNDLDQIIVSGTLLMPDARFRTHRTACRIFAPPFLTEPDAVHGGVRPRRTYLGPAYLGGFSDHLPLVIDFSMTLR